MRTGWLLTSLALVGGFWVAPFAMADLVPAHDIPGGLDNPLISRFPGRVIIGYHAVDFDQVVFPTGDWDGGAGKFTMMETVAGEVTDIAYAAPADMSAFEVVHNYQAALASAGFVTQYQCAGNARTDGLPDPVTAEYNATTAIASDNLRNAMVTSNDGVRYGTSVVELLSCISGSVYIETSRLVLAQGDVDLSLLICGNADKRVGTLIRVVEEKPMATGEVTVNAKAMSQGLARNGRIALYGIHFATDSAALTADSDATPAQMVSLLKSQPALKVYIAGHTDNTGTLAHNLVLSQQRADSVVEALEARGIAAPRLATKGLASHAPVASNDTAAGRAQNRRVELVKQ